MKDFAARHVAFLSIVLGLAFGLSYGDPGSNHPTYVPPGLMLVDPGLLSHDWWATTTTHYHWAFTEIVAALQLIGSVAWGLAIGNVLFIAAFLWVLWLIIGGLVRERTNDALLVWVCVAYYVTVTDGGSSVGDSFLFSTSLQPSTLATTFTALALYFFISKRLIEAGLALVVAGLFHVNFLVLNVLFFGLAQTLLAAMDWRRTLQGLGTAILDMAKLLAPSVLAIAASLPLILSVEATRASDADLQLAQFVLFDFAQPFHYRPMTYLPTLWSLVGWQLLGLAWTRAAVPDRAARQVWWALQASLILLVWTGMALITLIFVKPVAQLFFWRLAPFSELIAVMMFATGVFQSLRSKTAVGWPELSVSALGLAALARTLQYKFGILSKVGGSILLLPVVLLALAVAPRAEGIRGGLTRAIDGRPATLAVSYLLCAIAALALFSPLRFNVVAVPPVQADESALYAWIDANTPPDAQFVSPPELFGMRLFGHRAIIADLKAIPLDATNLVAWYRRLGAMCGAEAPVAMDQVSGGYYTLDDARLAVLRKKFAIDYAVVHPGMTITTERWVEVYRNPSFRVLRAK